jgi:pyruvate decarboxylase
VHGICRKWTKLLDTLGGEDGKTCKSYTVTNKQELDALLANPEFASASMAQLVEVIMPQHDAPRGLKVQAELSGQTNKYAVDVGVMDHVAPASS